MNEFLIGRPGGLQLAFSDLGATWLSCQLPLPDGRLRELLLRHGRLEDYLTEPGCLGGTIGRFANRIRGGSYLSPSGRRVRLAVNEGANTLHGGPTGFHQRRWRCVDQGPEHLQLALHSPDGDQGFPGALDIGLRISLGQALSLRLHWWAELAADAGEPSPVSLTNHAYFNLDGGGDTRRQRLRVLGSRMLPIDKALIPLGPPRDVAMTPFDLRSPTPLDAPPESDPQLLLAGGYDHCWLLDAPEELAAELHSADGRVRMQMRTSSPALQLYGGQYLDRTRVNGVPLAPHCALALEPQLPPDAPNRPDLPSPWLDPGGRLEHWVDYRFTVRTSFHGH